MDVLTWIQDSTDIIHAVIKWDVLPKIKKPDSLIAKYPGSKTDILGVFRSFELLRKNVHDSWKCRPETPPHGESNIQPQRLDAIDELKQVSRWLECVIKVSKGETDVDWIKRNVSVNARPDVVDKTDEVHEKLRSIFTKCMSLNKSDEQPETNKSEEKNQNEAPESVTNVSKTEAWTQTDIEREKKELVADDSKSYMVNLQKEIQRLKGKLDELTTERDIIRLRLSEITSAQLKKNNPGRADLSDPIRPPKIAEKYGRLYDDEWTDGFQHLNQAGSSVKESIEVLLQILKNTAQVPKSPDNLNTTAKITLNELRRQTSDMSKKTVINEYFNDRHWKLDKELTPYIEKCLELCWYMVLQSPPVYMELEQGDSNKKGSSFNKDLFRHYSRTGKKLGFIVWPPLYLHKDGPLMAKGVAQPEG